jgi:hypothetical protein
MEASTDIVLALTVVALTIGALAYSLLIRRRRRDVETARVEAALAETGRRRAVGRFRHLARWDVAESLEDDEPS